MGIVKPEEYGTLHYAQSQADVLGRSLENCIPEVHVETLESTNTCGLQLANDYECGKDSGYSYFDVSGCINRIDKVKECTKQCTHGISNGYFTSEKQQVSVT